MRVSSNWSLAIVLGASLAATISCQSVQKQSAFLPPAQAQAPALAAVSNPPQQKTPTPAPEPQAKAPVPQALQVDPVGDLIAQVEKYYQEGQENYRAGHLEAAKQNFDSAFNLLLGGGIDLRSDERLQHELDRILDGVNGLELLALQQGDGFTEQKSEPAPIDEANEVTFPVDPGIKAKAEAEIQSTRSDLPLMMTDPVAGYINYFSTRGRGTLERALARSGRYQETIQGILKEEGVPQDLIYLAQAESGFHPLAVSRAGARGMWQFMASRARGYGLERSWWVDDRQDPEKATRAAARHLRDLYKAIRGLVPGDGRLQLRPRHGAKRGQAHRLRRFLGTLPAQRSAQGNAQLRSHHSGRDHHGQESRAVRARGDRQGEAGSLTMPSRLTIRSICAWPRSVSMPRLPTCRN